MQQIRPSQFITTYGPGTILEGPDGPRLVPGLNVLFGDNARFSGQAVNFEIPEPRLNALLGPTAGILRLPTNAELGDPESREIYLTDRFPTWSLCATHGTIYQYPGAACPRCPRGNTNQQWDRAKREAIRFVLACPDGHLDDVPWHQAISHRQSNCRPTHYLWRGGGAALRLVRVECPDCGGDVNLGVAYARNWQCAGRSPERRIPTNDRACRPGCATPAKMIQKGAANLRLPSLRAALTIPRLDTRLHLILAQSNVRPILVVAAPASMADMLNLLRRLAQNNMISAGVISEVQQFQWPQVQAAIRDVVNPALPRTYLELLEQEFQELLNAAEFGAPSRASATPGGPPCFEVVKAAVQDRVRGPNGIEFRVAPVSRLRVVLVQSGFRRMDETGREVSNEYRDQIANRVWFPGVELYGEGIFIQLDPNGAQRGRLNLSGREASTWRNAAQNRQPPVDANETHPVHVWWHSLAHRLINALSVDSGYSSAAIRERVYVSCDANGDAKGGVLLYTVQPGGDGTLGGLIGLVPSFARLLRAATRDQLSCSNDPLCGEEAFDPAQRVNGAACYACQLVSETSCEHRNRWLDRNLLAANSP